ncbi:hypothetical protein [Spartinivicinus poritis]|uniref:Uncharacterized protein n=1 Tax=Spartinivicinus poritis TaxID=2994640 RepID=A0ABT5UGG2_9GAMM|nr:hypothetical protein [Spartinivicinus sp. A2-2]MDE1465469.1 hypothetical protein [Spartinivicinus sp. A2-2]
MHVQFLGGRQLVTGAAYPTCLGEPMPNLELLGQSRDQLGLGV